MMRHLTRQIFYRKLPPARNVRNQPARRQRATERHLTAKLNIYIALLFHLNYNSAVLGASLLHEEKKGVQIHVFNSCSASIGQTLIAMKIAQCEDAGLPFEDVVSVVNKYIEEQHTFFVLENLETLRKNGRLSRVKALVATALKIKPIMGSTPEGTICQLDQARGMNKALVKMVDKIVEVTENSENKILAISHCNSPKKANMLKEAIQEKMKLSDIVVLDTAGVSSMYANDGGIIVAV